MENSTMESRLQPYIERVSRNSEAATARLVSIQEQASNIDDYLYRPWHEKPIQYADGKLLFSGSAIPEPMPISDLALTQMLSREELPTRYVRKLQQTEWGNHLIAHNLNELITREPQPWLLRTYNGELRAALSDSYKRFPSFHLISRFLNAAFAQDAIITDVRNHGDIHTIELIKPDPVWIEVSEGVWTEFVFGARMRNSDFGKGALEIQSFSVQLICSNGMIGVTNQRNVHIGRKSQQLASKETILLDMATQLSQISDFTDNMFSKDVRDKEIARIGKAASTIIDVKKEVEALPKLGLLFGEAEEVEKTLFARLKEDGLMGQSNSLFNLSQAMSRVSQAIEGERREEVLKLASVVMDTPPSKLRPEQQN